MMGNYSATVIHTKPETLKNEEKKIETPVLETKVNDEKSKPENYGFKYKNGIIKVTDENHCFDDLRYDKYKNATCIEFKVPYKGNSLKMGKYYSSIKKFNFKFGIYQQLDAVGVFPSNGAIIFIKNYEYEFCINGLDTLNCRLYFDDSYNKPIKLGVSSEKRLEVIIEITELKIGHSFNPENNLEIGGKSLIRNILIPSTYNMELLKYLPDKVGNVILYNKDGSEYKMDEDDMEFYRLNPNTTVKKIKHYILKKTRWLNRNSGAQFLISLIISIIAVIISIAGFIIE